MGSSNSKKTKKKLDLSLQQNLIGFTQRILGHHKFKTNYLKNNNYEVHLISDQNYFNIQKIQLHVNKKIELEFVVINSMPNWDKSIALKLHSFEKFSFINFCILFKMFYQYLQEHTELKQIFIQCEQSQSYILKTLLGFKFINETDSQQDLLCFDMQESMQNIWDEFYGTNLNENLHHFILPTKFGGYVAPNVRLVHPNKNSKPDNIQTTEKLTCPIEIELNAQFKFEYKSNIIKVKDISTTGLALLLPEELSQQIKTNQCYTIWLINPHLNLPWTELCVEVLWKSNTACGCFILDKTYSWQKAIQALEIKNNQRMTFT